MTWFIKLAEFRQAQPDGAEYTGNQFAPEGATRKQ